MYILKSEEHWPVYCIFTVGRGGQRGQQKPGMPAQRSFQGGRGQRGRGGRGAGAGGGRGGFVPPVHSLAQVSTVDVHNMSDAEKMRRFCLFLNNEPAKVNSIQTIENALTGSKSGLKAEYQVRLFFTISFYACLSSGV